MSQTKSSRRSLHAAAAGSVFSVVPRYVIAGSGQTPPSERIRVAAIGCAGRPCLQYHGLAGCGAEIVGLCDVDTRRTERCKRSSSRRPFSKTTQDADELISRSTP